MVISTETICVPEQGYMFFFILEVYIQQCLFSKFSLSECKEKVESTIKLAWICISLHRKNVSILSCKSNYIKLHKAQSLLIKDYEVLFTNIKGREQSNIWCCCTVQEKDLCNFSQKQEVAN